MVYADGDGRKDLLLGQAEGNLKLYLNVNTDDDPQFDGGTVLQVGEPGFKTNIDVGQRATPVVVDWNGDGRRDIVAGAKDGYLRLYINEGTDSAWDFRTEQFVQEDGINLIVPTLRSSPYIADLDDDGKKDLLTGDTEGQVLFYSNVGTDEDPTFSSYVLIEADSVPINLAGLARSRPFVCDWTNDGLPDMLVGGSDGLVHLYQGVNATSAVHETLPPASRVKLLAAYPNPFNPIVTVPFVLSERRHVRISVYDISGRLAAVLVDGVLPEGSHRVIWRGVDSRGRLLPSGVYMIGLSSGGTLLTEKVVLIR
ncbi:MAG: T9SS type A sorting domain-containing protein [bacterium]|nr:MAG: T9SS type A sorting domain-containing protein [bacterium]